MWTEMATSSPVLWTRWMSPGGVKPLTSPTTLSLRPIRLRSASKTSSCSRPWMTPKTHHVVWSWIGVTWPGRQTTAMMENEPSRSTCSVWLAWPSGDPRRCAGERASVAGGRGGPKEVGDGSGGWEPGGVGVGGGGGAGDELVELVESVELVDGEGR